MLSISGCVDSFEFTQLSVHMWAFWKEMVVLTDPVGHACLHLHCTLAMEHKEY